MALVDIGVFQNTLAAAGKNYVRLDPGGGNVRTTTSGVFSRWRARSPDQAAQELNRATIDALVGKLRMTEGYGRQLANLVAGRLAEYRESGRPLSGRDAARIVSQANNEARDAFLRQRNIERSISDAVAQVTPDGLIRTMAGGLAAELGVTGELAAWQGAMRESVRTALTAIAKQADRAPTDAEVETAVRDALQRMDTAMRDVNGMATQTTVDGLIGTMAGDLALELGVTNDELAAWQGAIQESTRTALAAKAGQTGRTPTQAEAKQAILSALLRAFVDARGMDMLRAAQTSLQAEESLLHGKGNMLQCLRDKAEFCARAWSGAGAAGGPPSPLAALRGKSAELVLGRFREALQPVQVRAVPYPVEDDSQFCQAFNGRISIWFGDLGQTVPGDRLAELSAQIHRQATDYFMERRPLAMPDFLEYGAKCDELQRKFFENVDAYLKHPGFTDAERTATRRALLKTPLSLDPAFHPAMLTAQRLCGGLLRSLAADHDSPERTRTHLERFGSAFGALTQAFPKDAAQAVLRGALGAALETVAAGPALLGGLVAPGSAFLRTVEELSKSAPFTWQPFNIALGGKLAELLDAPENPWPQSALPIAQELLPMEHLRREGAVDLAEGWMAPATLSAWRENARQAIIGMETYSREEGRILHPAGFADPDDPRWTFSDVFIADLHRGGFLVDGRLLRDENAYLGMMPDRRTAAQVSRALHQGLGAIVMTRAEPRELREMLINATSAVVSAPSTVSQRGSASSLGGGAYRITYEFGKHLRQTPHAPPSPGVSAFTDMRCAISFTIRTGPEFSITDVDVDATVLAMAPR